MKYTLVDSQGLVVQQGDMPDEDTARLQCADGISLVLNNPAPSLNCYRRDDAWIERPARPGRGCTWDWDVLAWVDARDLQTIKDEALSAVNAAFQAAASALTSTYPEAEQKTWPRQEAEALAWQADSTAPTPYLDAVAAARGIDAVELRSRALAKVVAYHTASASLVGQRQALEDAIAAATTAAAVSAISWPAST